MHFLFVTIFRSTERGQDGSFGLNRGGMRKTGFALPQPPPGGVRVPAGYTCHRCGQQGHYIKFCPTNGDPNFDPVNRLLNVPMANRKKFTNLEGVDTANKTVVQNTDGSYEVFEPSKAAREKMARERYSLYFANDNIIITKYGSVSLEQQ